MARATSTLLIIDENNHRKTTLSSRLRALGHGVDSASGGFHAIHLIEKTHYDLVLIFDDMEDMPATEIYSIARTRHPRKMLPILLLRTSDHALSAGSDEIDKSEIVEWKDEFPLLLRLIQQFAK